MSQINRASNGKSYSLAGNQLGSFERILVSGSVELPLDAGDDADTRVHYRAPKTKARRQFGIPLPWVALLLVATVAIMCTASLRKAQTARVLEEEFAQLKNKYSAAEIERIDLEEQLIQASDASYICYYAAQNLGMTLALNEETIQLRAPETRPLGRMGEANRAALASRP